MYHGGEGVCDFGIQNRGVAPFPVRCMSPHAAILNSKITNTHIPVAGDRHAPQCVFLCFCLFNSFVCFGFCLFAFFVCSARCLFLCYFVYLFVFVVVVIYIYVEGGAFVILEFKIASWRPSQLVALTKTSAAPSYKSRPTSSGNKQFWKKPNCLKKTIRFEHISLKFPKILFDGSKLESRTVLESI